MARLTSLDFRAFVAERAAEHERGGTADHAYAYRWDRTTRAAFDHARPVQLAVGAAVRFFERIERAQLLGSAVKVGERQFPRVHALVRRCAETLGIPTPTVYIASSPQLNAHTYGTREDSFVMLHSALVDHFTDEELLSVIGHECGHIHNDHVVYLTTLHVLGNVAGALVRYGALPATLGLKAWSRRAEITCDRAGALCAGDVDTAARALTKLALGSQKLYQQLDIDVFLEQHAAARREPGRLAELFSTHPWIPKRVLALRLFGQSDVFHRARGEAGGTPLEAVDEQVHELIKVLA